MTLLKSLITFTMGIFVAGSVIAEDAKPPSWLFVHTAASAEMTSNTTLVMQATKEIFGFTDRPDRLHAYLNAHEFVHLWDEGEGDTFKADPPNAVLTWVEGDDVHEAELLITNAEIVGHGRFIAYEVTLEAGVQPEGELGFASFFIDSAVFVQICRAVKGKSKCG